MNRYGIDEQYLKEADQTEVKSVMQACADKRKASWLGNRGYTKNKNMRELSAIPDEIYWHPKLRHVFHNEDPIEGARLKREFLKMFPKFMCVEKM